MTNKHKNSSRNLYRRHALKALTGGLLFGSAATLLPSKWTKPVVNAVILPSHAQTSPGTDNNPGEACPPGTVSITDPGAPSVRFEVDTYDHTVVATGAAPFIFLFLQSPASATISSSGQILWNPEDDYSYASNPPPANEAFEVEVTDVNGCVASLSWTLEIITIA